MTGAPMLQARRSPWPLAIGLGLVATCAIQLTMVAIAATHRSAPAPGDHELEAVQFDHVLAARNRAAALGWRVDVESCQRVEEDGGCTLALAVRDADGHPVTGLHGVIAAARADDVALDRRAIVREVAPGRYASTLELGAGGVYQLAITLEGGPAPWIATREVLAPEVP